ncbi:RodZ domain-containing protein [uncultured Microbulbifer sp.]|uniref:RodZ domain-containing protein n=1 Tax=uncultured Microbulbifer sp. TaxID=348147 RepID=UPI0025DCEF7A|nr:RodZ domain-containing protein [uncultured Microbulbifer sp.]
MSSPESTARVMEEAAEVTTGQTAGSLIASARESAGLSVDELAGRMCMTPSKLRHLEQDDFERLAGATYVRGYLRNTCKELGIDAAPVLEAFERQLPAQVKTDTVPQPPRGPVIGHGKQSSGGGLFRPMLLVAMVAAAGGYWWINQGAADLRLPRAAVAAIQADSVQAETVQAEVAQPQASEPAAPAADPYAAAVVDAAEVTEALPESSAQLETASAPESEPELEPEPQQVAAAEQAPEAPEQVAQVAQQEVAEPVAAAPRQLSAEDELVESLAMTFTEESWVEVSDASGAKLLSKLQPAGSSVELEGEAPFNLMLGNAAGAVVSYRGEVVDTAPRGNRRTRKLTVGG